jgi:hypothetical protein
MQNQNDEKEQNCDDLKNKIDFTFNDYDEIDVYSTRDQRQRDVKSESQYLADIFLLFFDLVSEDCECFEKHHAFEDKQLRSQRNHRKTNAIKRFEKKHVVVVASTKRQRCANY